MWLMRWLLVAPLMLGGVWAAVFLGFLLFGASSHLCSALKFSEATCMVTWYPLAETIVVSICGIAASLSAILLPAAAAPTNKRAIAITGALVSLVAATWILVMLAYPLAVPLGFAVAAALLAVRRVSRQHAGGR